MKSLKMMLVIGAMSLALAAGPVWAQSPPAGQPPPAGQQKPPATQPPATQPPATQPPAQPPAPPKPFPEGARVAFINIQLIASSSAEGKAASAKIQDLQKKKTAELQEKQKQLQTLQTKLQQGGTVLSDQARSQTEKDIDRLNRELQFAQEDARQEIQDLQTELQNQFQQKLQPVIDAIANEKGLHMVFSIADSGVIWANMGLDLSSEVIKRFDAAAGTKK